MRTLLLFLLMPLSACQAEPVSPGKIQVPDGFEVSVFATDVPGARSMTLADDGTLFVGSRGQGRVYALRDNDQDGQADEQVVLADGLDSPNGVAVRGNQLYVAAIDRILRYPLPKSGEPLEAAGPPEIISTDFPDDRHHGWKFIAFGPDGRLYVPIGAPCNVCQAQGYAVITSMEPDGSDHQIYARGVRNTVGFDWHPETGDLWFSDNGRDWMGDNRPPDELNHAPEPGLHFGFPFCHGGDIPDPEYGEPGVCDQYQSPARKLGPHVASLGMRFYTGDQFPDEYRNQIFIAEHGSWNRSEKIGYRVSLVRLEGDRAMSYETFASGWLEDDQVHGRPVDVQVLPDGSLLVSDDHAGAIYRIAYTR